MADTGREMARAIEHPRASERRALLPYRDALNDVAAYARLPEHDRDAIVRWTEIRRRLAEEHAIDADPANLADPLVPYRTLRTRVLEGERLAARRPDAPDGGGDLFAVVAAIRR